LEGAIGVTLTVTIRMEKRNLEVRRNKHIGWDKGRYLFYPLQQQSSALRVAE
jgi:hypothetical protein